MLHVCRKELERPLLEDSNFVRSVCRLLQEPLLFGPLQRVDMMWALIAFSLRTLTSWIVAPLGARNCNFFAHHDACDAPLL